MTVISTFAGCGGSSLGYQMAGFKELLAVEWDDNAVATFRLNFPDVPIYHGDICKLSGDECMRLAGIGKGELDVLDGSPPCQGFSTAGKRRYDDPRNSLFKEYARLLNDLQPRVFVMENVTGMVKGYMKQAYLEIVKTLRGCGYRVKGQILNAMFYGVPQARQRVVLIGTRNDMGIEPSHPRPSTCPRACGDVLLPPESVCSLTYKGGLTGSWHRTPLSESVSKGFADWKLDPMKPAPTIRKAGALWHWMRPLPLQRVGYSRLASFPDSFKWVGTESDAKDRIGNSVPPLLMKAIAEHIRDNILTKVVVCG